MIFRYDFYNQFCLRALNISDVPEEALLINPPLQPEAPERVNEDGFHIRKTSKGSLYNHNVRYDPNWSCNLQTSSSYSLSCSLQSFCQVVPHHGDRTGQGSTGVLKVIQL